MRVRLFLRRTAAAAWTAVAILLIGAGVIVGLGRLLLPFAPNFQPEIEAWLSEELDSPVAVGSLTAEWAATGPLIRLEDVTFLDPQSGRSRLELGEAQVALNLLAWVSPGFRLTDFRLSNTHLTLERTVDNRLRLLGFGQGGDAASDPVRSLDWFFNQGSISIVDSAVDVIDRRRDLIMRFRDVNLTLDNQDQLHRVVGSAGVPEAEGGRIEFRIALQGDVARRGIRDARLYARGDNVALHRWLQGSSVAGARVNQGRTDFEVWGTVAEGRARSVRGSLALSEISLRSSVPVTSDTGVRLAPSFAAEAIRGHFRWLAREDGWQLDVNLEDWRGDRGRAWPESGLSLAWDGDTWHFGSEYLRLEDVVEPMVVFATAGQELRRRLLALSPAGEVRGVRGRWNTAAEPARALTLQAGLEHVAWQREGDWPSIEGVNGRLRVAPGSGFVQLDSRRITVGFPALFRQPVSLGQVSGRFYFRDAGPGWVLEAPRLKATASGARAVSRLRLAFQGDGSRPFIDLRSRLAGGSLDGSKEFMPVGIMHPDLVRWLDRALVGGRVEFGRTLVYGDLDHWPFDGGTGRFEMRARVLDADLDYREGWPRVNGARADLLIEGRSMQMTSTQGRVFDAEVERVVASIEDLERPWLNLDIRAEGPASSLLRYLRESPLNEKFGPYIEGLSVTGAARVEKSLRLPLKDELGDRVVDGTVTLSGADITDAKWGLSFTDTHGRIRFDDKGFVVRGMDTHLEGHPVTLAMTVGGEVDRDTATAHLTGRLPPEALIGDRPALAPVLAGLQGSAVTHMALTVPKSADDDLSGARLRVRSNLAGVAVNLPAPLRKPVEQRVPLTLELPVPYEGGIIDLRYGGRMAARFHPGAEGGPRAALHFGTDRPALPAGPGVVVTGRPGKLDLDGWLASFAAPAGGDGLSLDRVDLQAGELVALQRSFPDVDLRVTSEGDGWHATIDSEAVAGTVEVPEEPGVGLVGEFRRLRLPPAPEGVTAPSLDPRRLPPLHLLAEDFRLGNTRLGRARLEAYPIRSGLRVDMVKADTPSYTLLADGRWVVDEETGEQRSEFDLTITAENLGGMLSSFGYVGLVENGQTIAHLDAGWPGAPTDFALERLGGDLEVTVGPGRILQVEPGAGRVFGLLSLQQLPRRLTLDFSDLFNAGLSFDAIQGNFRFSDGSAYTDDFTLSGPSAFIQVQGRVDLGERVYDQRVTVYPSVGNTLPLVGALAGGPTGAAAMFLLQNLFEKQISQMTAYHYAVTGSWSDPDIELLETREPGDIARSGEPAGEGG